jgi:hypothetical protein
MTSEGDRFARSSEDCENVSTLLTCNDDIIYDVYPCFINNQNGNKNATMCTNYTESIGHLCFPGICIKSLKKLEKIEVDIINNIVITVILLANVLLRLDGYVSVLFGIIKRLRPS